MTDKTLIALRNYDWLIHNRDASIHWDTDPATLVWGDGGASIETLCEPGSPRLRNNGSPGLISAGDRFRD